VNSCFYLFTKENKITVRIKEVLIRYEDDGETSPLTALEHKEKYRPLNMIIHHHCSPPPNQSGAENQSTDDKPTIMEIDLDKLAEKKAGV
jgi:hypothetical protein